jgi:hypothetical protein
MMSPAPAYDQAFQQKAHAPECERLPPMDVCGVTDTGEKTTLLSLAAAGQGYPNDRVWEGSTKRFGATSVLLQEPGGMKHLPSSHFTGFGETLRTMATQQQALHMKTKRLAEELGMGDLLEVVHSACLDIISLKEGVNRLLQSQISRGSIKRARVTLQFAVQVFGEDDYYRKVHAVLAPPRVIETKPARPMGLRESLEFIKKHRKELNKTWVALSRGELLGVSDRYADLLDRFRGEDVLITRVV